MLLLLLLLLLLLQWKQPAPGILWPGPRLGVAWRGVAGRGGHPVTPSGAGPLAVAQVAVGWLLGRVWCGVMGWGGVAAGRGGMGQCPAAARCVIECRIQG